MEKEEIGQSNGSTRSDSNIYKCKVTDHPANVELHEKAHNNNNNQENGTYFSHNNNPLSLSSGKYMNIFKFELIYYNILFSKQ